MNYLEVKNYSEQLRFLKKYIVLIVLGAFTIILAIKNIIDHKRINNTGSFVLAAIKSYDFSSRGTTYTYEYSYNEKSFVGKTLAVGWNKKIGDLIILHINLANPKIYDVTNVNAPFCWTLDMQPKNGWETLPKNNCAK